MRVLVVEDYVPLRHALVRGLKEAGYAVDAAREGEEALICTSSRPYDVIVLDIMLPVLDGLEVLRRLRAAGSESRVLILTARDGVPDRVRGLDLGADDYLVKPFAFSELLARVRALTRRRHGRASPTVTVGELVVDTAARRVTCAGQEVDLTAREYSVLEVLALRAGHVVTRDEVSHAIYAFDKDPGSNVVDVYIGYLRKKLDAAGSRRLIHTKRGLGYVLRDGP